MLWSSVKILALIAVAAGCFVVRDPRVLAGVVLLELAIWGVLRLPLAALYRTVRKLAIFAFFIMLTYALVPTESMQADIWVTAGIGSWQIPVNQTGFIFGVVVSLRMLVVVLASIIVQLSGKPEDFVAGLRGLGVPEVTAITVDNTFRLLNSESARRPGSGGGRGGGGGGGGGRGRQTAQNAGNEELTWRRILRGDFAFLNDVIENALVRARNLTEHGSRSSESALPRDAVVITALCFLMLTTKMLKVLPGIPFAPGHKLILLIPLYILAGALTQSRWGATFAGTSIGIISFLFGEGRFGVLEILKHIAPGLVVDALLPWLLRGRSPSRWEFVMLGALCAAARITTIVAVTFLIDAPAVFYALVAPMFISQTAFGAASGFITFYLLKSLDRFRRVLDVRRPSQVGT